MEFIAPPIVVIGFHFEHAPCLPAQEFVMLFTEFKLRAEKALHSCGVFDLTAIMRGGIHCPQKYSG
jgi:hypothetical protein